MSELLLTLAMFLMIAVLFFGNYAVFARTVIKWCNKPKKVKVNGAIKIIQPGPTVGQTVLCCIPVWQAVEVRKALYGRAGVFGGLAIASIALILINFVTSFILSINGYVMFFGHICFYIGFLIAWVISGIITADCARMYDFKWIAMTLNFILPNVFCFYLSNNIPHIMIELRKQKTFEESDRHKKSKS